MAAVGRTSVVDAPRLVSADASPIRAEWAVTRASTPDARADAWNRSPTICGESGTTWSLGDGLAADRSVWSARATSPFTNRTSFVSPSGFVLPTADRHQHPVAGGRLGDLSAHRRALTLLRRKPRHEEQPRDHRVEAAALQDDLV